MRPRLGVVILPEHRWPDAGRVWKRAEELGFDHAWTYDHLAWRMLRNDPWFDAVPTLTAAAMVTERMRLGTLVASANFRHPVPFARELLALDDISAGRFTFGVGAGGEGWDAAMLGHEPWSAKERAERFGEFVELTDLLLREREVDFAGKYYSAVEARSYPGCVQQPRLPFAVAATGQRGMKLVARFGQAWVTFGRPGRAEVANATTGAAEIAAQLELLSVACAAAGRDPSSIDRIVLTGLTLSSGLGSVEELRDTLGAYAEAGITDFVVHWPRPTEPYRGDVDTFERVVGEVLSDPRAD